MKRSVLLMLSLLFGISTQAQTIAYQPLHGNYTQYVYRFQHWNGSENVETLSKTIWSGDSIINGQHYVRIFQGGAYTGGIREDVPNQQRFFINTNDIETDITIDYDLPVGTLLTDSSVFLNAFRTYLDVYPPFFQYNDTLVIAAKDSVLESSGNYSVNYRLTDGGGSGESVLLNTYSGLLEINGFEYNYSQICYREDGEQTPPGQDTPWSIMCDLGISENNSLEISLSPNPSTNFIELSGKDLSLVRELAIYNVHGTRVKNIQQSEINSGILLTELDSGMYFMAFNGSMKTLRFVKE